MVPGPLCLALPHPIQMVQALLAMTPPLQPLCCTLKGLIC